MSDPVKRAGEPDSAAERDLIRRAQQGDQAALEQLLTQNQDLIYRTALRFTAGREEAAHELAQEVMISVFRHIGQFRSQSRFSTWLYRIACNLGKNRYVVENRERARYTSLDHGAGSDDDDESRPMNLEDDRAVDPRKAAAGAEKMAIMRERLETLEPEWREVILLRFFEDLSYEEIAEALQVPVGTVKSRINRARRALREAMADVLAERGDEP